MKYDVITIGGATEDITFYTDEGVLINNKKDLTKQKLLAFEYGAKVKVDKSFSGFGGGAANAAVSLSGFGFKAACLCAIGEDSRGQRILSNLQARGVDITLVQKIKGVETGFSFLLVGPSNEHIVFSNRAANNELTVNDFEIGILDQSEWIYLTSLSGEWKNNLEKIFSVKNEKLAWNPGHRQILTGIKGLGKYFKKTTCLIVNKDEAIELVMSDKKYKAKGRAFLNNVKNLLAALSSYGPKIVVITGGRQGADAMFENKIYHQPIIKETRRADTTGVGDAFGSAFIAGLELYNQDIKKSLLLAAKNAASVISIPGAQNGLLSKKNI
ncbi:MAG: PfkB family carbohydrate kinase [Patescibacteria group bacterium]|nr:PfkB family carbohydrate kinase [Patescibacteria group bacterium]